MHSRPETTCYIATGPDGVISTSSTGGTPPVSLAHRIGETIDHPRRGGTFDMVTAVGEALEDVRSWPARLFTVQPVGESRVDDPARLPYVHSAAAVLIGEEVEAHRALGPRGHLIPPYLTDELPGLARTWAQDFTDDEQGVTAAWGDWRLRNTPERARGTRAQELAVEAARSSRREAALNTMLRVALTTAEEAATAQGSEKDAAYYAGRRAQLAIAALLLEDQLTTYVLNALRGSDLDRPRSTPTNR